MDQSGSEAVDLTTLLHPQGPEKEVVPEAQTTRDSGAFTDAMFRLTDLFAIFWYAFVLSL